MVERFTTRTGAHGVEQPVSKGQQPEAASEDEFSAAVSEASAALANAQQMHDDLQQCRREVEESWRELNLLITKAKAGQVDAAPGFIIAGHGLRPP
jgi:hypothetical protein